MVCHFDFIIVFVNCWSRYSRGQFPKIFAVCKPLQCERFFFRKYISGALPSVCMCVCYSDFHNTGRREKSKSQAFKVGRIIFVLPLCVECRFCPRATQMRKKKVEKRYIGEEMIYLRYGMGLSSQQQPTVCICYAGTAYYLQSSACNDSDWW